MKNTISYYSSIYHHEYYCGTLSKTHPKGTLIFKTDYDNFKNMMSYADNEYTFNMIPITFAFYECTSGK